MNLRSPLRIWLLAGTSSVLLAAVVVTLCTPAVQANVRLTRFTGTAPPISQARAAAPELLAPSLSAEELKAYRLKGIASWYGGVFNGRKTASGERYNMYAMTACHPTLPFGSMVRVVNLKNQRTVVVRITDRGDLMEEGRIIDLSFAAAERLAMVKNGLAKVNLEVLSLGETRKHE